MTHARSWFDHATAAQRYARHRPYFHPRVVERMRQRLALVAPARRALDVACGTGQSTVALLPIADRVVGADVSMAMLAEAQRDPRTSYVAAAAEHLPFANGSFDLVTVALGLHWFQRDVFLTEVRRLLPPGGWLVVYNNAFRGKMSENAEFHAWMITVYVPAFPAPARGRNPPDDNDAMQAGCKLVAWESYDNEVVFTPDSLVNYLMTQSNVLAAVERGDRSPADVRAWLLAQIMPLFPVPSATFAFGGDIWYLQRTQLCSD